MEEGEMQECNIETDTKTKLPYVMSPTLGRYDYVSEKCYFIPVGVLS